MASPTIYRHALVSFNQPRFDDQFKDFSFEKENIGESNSPTKISSEHGRKYSKVGSSPLTLRIPTLFSSDSSSDESSSLSPTLRQGNLFDEDSSNDMGDSPQSPLKGKNLFGSEESTEESYDGTSEDDSPQSPLKGKNLFGGQDSMDHIPLSPVSLNFSPLSSGNFTPFRSGKKRSEELDQRTCKLTPEQKVHKLTKDFQELSSPSKDVELSGLFRVPAPMKRSVHPSRFNNPDSYVDFETPVTSQNIVVRTPPTPYKPKQKIRASEFVTAVMSTSEKLYDALSSKSGSRAKFCAGEKIGEGYYSNVYEIDSNKMLFEGYQNDQLLIKCYNTDTIGRNGSSAIESFGNYSLKQYHQLKELSFPVVNILNAATVKQDGFFIVERVPTEFFVPENFDLSDLSPDHPLMQVKAMFQFAFDHDIDLDLSMQNVRINAEGKVILIDLMEEDQGTFKELLNKHLMTFAKTGPCAYDQKIYDFLMPTHAIFSRGSSDDR